MHFTDEQHEALYQAYCEDLLVTIEACNSFGQEFTVIGKIASVLGEEIPELNPDPEEIYAGVFDNSIILEFPDKTQKEDDLRSKYNAIFFNTLESEESKLSNFLIKRIRNDKTGQILFENKTKEYKHQVSKGVTRFYNYNLNKKMLGKPTASAHNDNFFWLYNLVGKPININDLTGVLFCADSVTKSGDIMLHFIDCMQFKTTAFSSDSKITLEGGVVKIDSPEQITLVTNREETKEF